jgi:Family of unknown function (DUF6085)
VLVTVHVNGFCPECGTPALRVSDGGDVYCTWSSCPRPNAAGQILRDSEIQHVVQLGERTFNLLHPLRERLGDRLLTCNLLDWIAEQPTPPYDPGRYRVTGDGSTEQMWTRLA